MTEATYPDYRLKPWVFQAWLRDKFNDNSIVVECRNAEFVFNLPSGAELTELKQEDDLKIVELRDKSTWP
ncbi:hypothetical protein LB504_000074 [Fusarium proliferatum]|nr:hypothetical protein LB504_000074 [Fusarium proliferatum]